VDNAIGVLQWPIPLIGSPVSRNIKYVYQK
jgi:hypothetical protein